MKRVIFTIIFLCLFFPAYCANYTNEFYGFKVESSKFEKSGDSIILHEAFIILPKPLGGGKQLLKGLEVSAVDNAILAPGVGAADAVITTSYGDTVKVKEYTLSADGFFASRFIAQIPFFIKAEKKEIELTNLTINSDGTTGMSDEIEDFSFSMVGFLVTEAYLLVDSTGIAINNMAIDIGTDEPFYFNELTVTGKKVVSNGTLDYPVGIYNDWYIELSLAQFSTDGITGSATIQLPYKFGSREIIFRNFRLNPDGSYIPGDAGETYIRICGWISICTGVVLEGPEIKIAKALVKLHSSMNWGEITIPDVVITSKGNIKSCGTGINETELISTNGFKMVAKKAIFTNKGMFLAGNIYLPPKMRKDEYISVKDMIVELNSAGSIITPELPGPVKYIHDGERIAAKLVFDLDGLTIYEEGDDQPQYFYPDGEKKTKKREW